MNPLQPAALDRVFPFSAGSSERPRLRAPRLAGAMAVTPGVVMGNRAFMRAWAARRAARQEPTLGWFEGGAGSPSRPEFPPANHAATQARSESGPHHRADH